MSVLETVLLQALDMLTEGKDAPVTEALRPEAAAVQKAARPWTKGRGIQGLGITKRITAGKETDELALKVYVERKLPKSKCSNLAPSIIRIAGLSEKVPTALAHSIHHELGGERGQSVSAANERYRITQFG